MKKNTIVITIIIPMAILCFSNIALGSRIFSTRLDVKLDTRLYSVVTGDLNGDNVPDLIAGGEVNLLVLLGNGDGTFTTEAKYPISSGGSALAIDDLNNDGVLDFAVAKLRNYTFGVSVLLGNGDGTFSIAGDYATGDGATSIAIGDLNGDQTPDMAVANMFSNDLSVLLGNGDGTFQMAANYATGDWPSSVAMGDLDGDSVLDLVVVNEDYVTNGNISVLLGNGDGSFGTAVKYLASGYPTSIVLGDLNGDGALDLVTGNGNSDNISVLLGNGDGTFKDAMHYYSKGGAITSVAIGDMNGDGIQDLVTANDRHENVPDISTISVRFGNGDGTFQNSSDYPVGSGPESLAISDFDGNGVLDLVTANYWSEDLSMLFGNGDGTFPVSNSFKVSGRGPYSVAIGDLNGDGIMDMATADSLYTSWIDTHFEYNVSVLLGNENGTFQKTKVNYQAGSYPRSIVIDDFDGDRRLDLAVANMYSDDVSVLLGRGDGTFYNAMNFAAGEEPYSVDVGDLDEDGAIDLVVANSGSNDISVLIGNGDGTFHAAVNYHVGDSPVCVAIGDLDGDGAADLVTANSIDNDVSVLIGTGDGIFRVAMNYQAGDGPSSVAIGDLDGDGAADLVTANSIDNDVSVLLGNGNGTFRAAMNYKAGDNPTSVAIGDLDGDGVLDLAVAIRLSENVAVLNGNGDGTFQSAIYYMVGAQPQSVAIEDLDQDGALDLAVANWYSGDVTVLKNRSVTLYEVNPTNGQVAVPVNTTITATFNQAMAPSSIDSNSFYLIAYDSSTFGTYPTNISGSVAYNGMTATFTPSFDLLPETRYEPHITTSVQNLSGLHLPVEYTWEFTTGKRPAITGTVMDSNGQPIEALPVCAYEYFSGQEIFCFYTEKNGRFAIMELPSGVYRIYADTSGTEYRAEYYDNSISSENATPVEVIDGQTTSGIDFVLEKDSDWDGLCDSVEEDSCTDPYDSDTDDDGIPDGAEDINQNGIMDTGETNPCNPDTDGDGIQDGTEIGYTMNDIGADTDLNIFIPDEDPDTTTDPLDHDMDHDGRLDGLEDADRNGMIDGTETDPNDPLSVSNQDEWADIYGTIAYEGTPLCAMVLANGQYMFTCGETLGLWDLEVPLDQNAEITLYGFCSGMAPFKTVLTQLEASNFDINMTRAAAGSREIEVDVNTEPGFVNSNWIRISGTVYWSTPSSSIPLCTMVLANGQSMFSCGDALGTYDLEVPLDENGEITLYVFCSGFAPYKQVFMP